MTAVGFEPTPLRTGAWSQRLRPLGQTVLTHQSLFKTSCTWHAEPNAMPPHPLPIPFHPLQAQKYGKLRETKKGLWSPSVCAGARNTATSPFGARPVRQSTRGTHTCNGCPKSPPQARGVSQYKRARGQVDNCLHYRTHSRGWHKPVWPNG